MEKKVIDKKPTEYNLLQDRLTRKVNPLFHGDKGINIYAQLKAGQNHYLKLDRLEETTYDPRWLDQIEDCIPDIDAIVKNPKKVIENVSEVVPIELARKTNADSVKHLSTHSQFVKEVDDDGNVIPNKILNIRSDDFYQTYENRFVATLIRRLVLFVEKRYQIIQNNAQVQRTEMLLIKNSSVVDGKKVEIETKVKVSSEIEISEEERIFNTNFLKRVDEVRKYLLYFYDSDFMKMMKTEKNVRNPIILTNILRKNHVYNHTYCLYKFIEKFDNLGIDFKVKDDYEVLSGEQQEELNNALMTSFLALRGHETTSSEIEKLKVFKPKVLTSIDDEAFIYGDYVHTPIEFVRVDQAHRDYLASQISTDIPKRPTKQEKEYYGDEIDKAKEIKKEIKEIERLIREKEKEAIKDDRYFNDVVTLRAKQEEYNRLVDQKALEQQQFAEIEAARRALMGEPGQMDELDINEFDSDINSVNNIDFPINQDEAMSPFTLMKEYEETYRLKKMYSYESLDENTYLDEPDEDVDIDNEGEVETPLINKGPIELDPARSPFDIMKEYAEIYVPQPSKKINKPEIEMVKEEIPEVPNTEESNETPVISTNTTSNIAIPQVSEAIDDDGLVNPFKLMKDYIEEKHQANK